MFKVIEDCYAILRKGGVYRQTALFGRQGKPYVYASYGTGFIQLYADNGTSISTVKWDELIIDFAPKFDKLGRMVR